MDLKHQQITVRELLANPAAKKVLTARFPHVINQPIVKASGNLTLERALEMGAAFVPKKFLQETVQELKRI